MENNPEQHIQPTEESGDAPGGGFHQDMDLHDDSPGHNTQRTGLHEEAPRIAPQRDMSLDEDSSSESMSLEIPKEDKPSRVKTKEVSNMDVASPSSMSPKTKSSKKISSKKTRNNSDSKRDDSSYASTLSEVDRLSLELPEMSTGISNLQMRQETLNNPQVTFYYPRDSSSSDDDSDVEKADRPFRIRKGRRTFSQCDSPDDSGLDFKIYDSEAKDKKANKDHTNKLKKKLGTTKASNTIENASKLTSVQKKSKSDSEILQTKCEKSKLSCPLTVTRCLSTPLLADQKTESKLEKLTIKSLKIFKFETKSKSVSTQTENISDVATESGVCSENVDSHLSDSNETLSGQISDKTELNTIKAELESTDNLETLPSPINTSDYELHCTKKNSPPHSNRDKTVCLLSKTSDDPAASEKLIPLSEATSEKHLDQTTGVSQLKLEGPQINPLDDACASDAPENQHGKIQPVSKGRNTLQDDSSSSSVKEDPIHKTKFISECAEVNLSPKKDKLNLSGQLNVDLNTENTGTSSLTKTEKTKAESDPPPAVFKIPSIRRVPKSRSKSEKHSSQKTTENIGASTSQSPKRPTDLNVGERSTFYSFFPGRDQNNILRPCRSLPNVNSAPRKSGNRRSVNLDIVRTAVRALFTRNPESCTSSTRESGNMSNIGLLAESIKTPSTEEISRDKPNKVSDKALSVNAIKAEAKKPNFCRKLNFDSPQKEKSNVNPTLQEFSSSEIVEGVSGLCLYDVSHPSSEDDVCGQASPPERKPTAIQAADSPDVLITEVSSDLEMEADSAAIEESRGAADSQSLLKPSEDAVGNISPSKRKSEGLENALSSESPRKRAVLSGGFFEEPFKRPVKKGRLSLELDPDETEAKGEDIALVKDDSTDQKDQGSPRFLTPQSCSSRDSISPSKRKAEELDTEKKSDSPSVSPRRSMATAKRTKVKLPIPTIKLPDSDEK